MNARPRIAFHLLLATLLLSVFAPVAQAYYSPSTGRFTSRDPLSNPHFESLRVGHMHMRSPRANLGTLRIGAGGAWTGVGNPNREMQNLYEYVQSNPMSRVDPMGLLSIGWKEASCILFHTAGSWAGLNAAREAANRALEEARKRFPGQGLHNGPGDAWRHCCWMCLLARNPWLDGDDNAKWIGICHENAGDRKGQPPGERDMDLHNNDVGIEIGSRRPRPSREDCATGCDEALRDGRLITSPGAGTPDDDYYRESGCGTNG